VGDRVNACCSADLTSDALWDGRRFRTFNVVDNYHREALEVEVDVNLPAGRAIRTLDGVAASPGYPERLRLDNGPEFVAIALAEWMEGKCVQLEFIPPGRPMQRGFIERFNGSYRGGALDLYVFRNLTEFREHTERWLHDYNEEVPNASRNGLTPIEYRQFHTQKPPIMRGPDQGRSTHGSKRAARPGAALLNLSLTANQSGQSTKREFFRKFRPKNDSDSGAPLE